MLHIAAPTCLITDTGLTIMDVFDENMEDLLYINRVSIASEVKDLLLQHLDIESIWNTNINGKSSDYQGISIKHKNGEMSYINMLLPPIPAT